MLYKNTASQKMAVYAYTASTGAAKTGEAAQITGYISKDWGAAAAISDTNPTELDATNMPGWYVFDMTQAETNAEVLIIAAKSSTSGVLIDQYQVVTEASLPQTGDAYAVVNHADYGNAKLVRSTTPANTLTVDASHQALALTNAITNDAITAAAIANGAIDAATFAAGAITENSIAASAITNANFALTAGSQVWNTAVRSLSDKTGYSLSASGLNEISIKAASGVWNNVDRIVTGGSISATSGSVVAITVEDKTGYSIAASGIGSTAIGASAINDQSITDGTRNEISKNLLKFDLSTITGEAARSVLNAIRFLRNKWSISGTTLTVTKENDTDAAWQAEVSSTESADPITGIDPG